MRADGPPDLDEARATGSAGGSPGRAALIGLLLVLIAALGLRLARLSEVRAAPDYRQPAVDAAFHDWWARAVAGLPAGPETGRDPALLERAYLRPPGYPIALGAVYALSGGSHLAARWFQLVLGLISTGLVWWVLQRSYGPGAALLGGLAIGCHWLPLYFEGELQATALALALLMGATAAFLLWFERPGPARAFALGLLLGLCAVVRPNALFVLLGALILGTLELRRRRSSWRRFALPLAAGAALAILPVTARNLVVAGEAVLISTNAGVNLYIGNHPGATGRVAAHLPDVGAFETCFDYPELVRRVQKRAGRELSDREVSAWFTARALAWMRAEPGQALRLLGRKALLLFGPAEIPHNKELALERQDSNILRWLPFPFGLLLAGAVFGLFAALRRERGDPARALAVFSFWGAAAWLLSVLPFFVAARYRVPVLPWLVVLASLGLGELWRLTRAGRTRSALTGAAVLAGLALLFSTELYTLSPDRAKWHHDRGRALLRDGQPERALVELEQSLAADPRRFEAELSLANALAELGRTDRAVAAYRNVLERRPKEHRALNDLGVLLAERGELAEAAQLFERALARNPLPGPVHLNLARAYEGLGDAASAREHHQRVLEHLPGNREARRALRRLENAPGSADDRP